MYNRRQGTYLEFRHSKSVMKYRSNKFNFKINGVLAKSWFWEADLPFGNAQFAQHTFIYSCFNPNLSDFIANKAIRYLLSSCLETPTSIVPYLALGIEDNVRFTKSIRKKGLQT